MEKGFMSDEERKKPFEYHTEGFTFRTNQDLSKEIQVTPDFAYSPEKLSTAVSIFIANFLLWNFPRLNGFSGFGAVRWKVLPAQNIRVENEVNKLIASAENLMIEKILECLLEMDNFSPKHEIEPIVNLSDSVILETLSEDEVIYATSIYLDVDLKGNPMAFVKKSGDFDEDADLSTINVVVLQAIYEQFMKDFEALKAKDFKAD